MDRRDERIYAYGISTGAGPYECVDCGHHLEHTARGPLPPCPRYRDSTHTRAGWHVAVAEGRGPAETAAW